MTYNFGEIVVMLLNNEFKVGQILVNTSTDNTPYMVSKSNIGWSLKRRDEVGYYTPYFGSAQFNGEWIIK